MCPPSTTITVPVTHAPALLVRYSTAPPMSAALPRRRMGTLDASCSSGAYVSSPRLIREGMYPGAIALTVTRGASSDASLRVSMCNAALKASYE